MKSKDVFGVIVRLFGMVFLYQAVTAAPSAVVGIWIPHFYFRNFLPLLFSVAWPLLLGFWLVTGAPWLMRLAYRNEAKESAVSPAASAFVSQ